MRAVSGTAGTDTTSPLWQPQPAKTTRREWHEERGLPQWLSHIVSFMAQFAGNYQLSNQRRGPLAGPSCVRVEMADVLFA